MTYFESELEMSNSFREFLDSLLVEEKFFFLKEYKGPFGVPDFILIEKYEGQISHVISIELKLKNWKKAVKQAFRYRCFSHQAFVILDKNFLNPAISNISYFKHFNIGLASFDNSKNLNIHHAPEKLEPLSDTFFQKLESDILGRDNVIHSFGFQFSSPHNYDSVSSDRCFEKSLNDTFLSLSQS